MRLDLSSPMPVYLQIADLVRRSIAAGVYRPGEAIPSVRALALELTVNPNTVQRAFDELEREGLIRTRKGLGMFVTDRAVSRAQRDSHADVRRTFVDALRAAGAAGMTPEQAAEAFDRAWQQVFKAVGSKT
jgi:GntR family transcriptional regulator